MLALVVVSIICKEVGVVGPTIEETIHNELQAILGPLVKETIIHKELVLDHIAASTSSTCGDMVSNTISRGL